MRSLPTGRGARGLGSWLAGADRALGSVQHPAMPAPGWVAAQTLRHTEGLADLDDAEAGELGPLLRRLSAAVTWVTDSERVYTYSLGEGSPHTHILLGPPLPDLRGAAFITALMRRDASLADEAAALRVARDLAGELATGITRTMGKR
ncbi:hypothetical protein [Streptomyces sp. NPDC002619]|uniref:hypothetical protein n=1 Tax=Streptomyces sp. NPDC002619 TaxID=3364655 RepID=UPI0036ADA196